MITADKCRELFEYCDGELYWREQPRPDNPIDISRPAGSITDRGYRDVMIAGKSYRAHRLIFLMTHDYLPEAIDHIDGNKLNNTPSNLRPATSSQNGHNRGKNKNNTTGFKGVHAARGRYRAMTNKDGKSFHLGYFDTAEQAHAAYCEASERLHGEFARTE